MGSASPPKGYELRRFPIHGAREYLTGLMSKFARRGGGLLGGGLDTQAIHGSGRDGRAAGEVIGTILIWSPAR